MSEPDQLTSGGNVPAAAAAQFVQGHALIVGVGADLPDTVTDAQGLRDVLIDPARCAYPPAQVRLLTGEQAVRAKVLAALDTLAATTTADSTVVIYFSGHGCRVAGPAGIGYYLIPFGYDLARLGETAIADDELSARLRSIAARKLLLLLDCCHAGGFDPAKAPGVTLKQAPLPPGVAEALAGGRGRVGIASSRADEVSFAGAPYSAFTLALLEGLSGCDVAVQDGFVRAADLALYAAKTVASRTHDRQHPVLTLDGADNFAVAWYAAGEATPKGLPFTQTPQIEPDAGAWRRDGRPVIETQTVVPAPAFVQPGWHVSGDVVQVQGDATFGAFGARPRRRRRPQ
jgi:hypothetical protein